MKPKVLGAKHNTVNRISWTVQNHRIIWAGSILWRSLVQLPTQSKGNSKVRSSFEFRLRFLRIISWSWGFSREVIQRFVLERFTSKEQTVVSKGSAASSQDVPDCKCSLLQQSNPCLACKACTSPPIAPHQKCRLYGCHQPCFTLQVG